MDPAEPNLFETLRLPNVAALCFVVRCKDNQIRPETIPAAGVAYNSADYKLPTRLHIETWGSYKCGWPTEAPAGYSAFVFVPSLPTAPVVKPRLDPIWGNVLDHTYYCLRSSTQLDIAETGTPVSNILGASYASRHVIAVAEPREMSGEVIEVTVTTSPTATVTQTDKLVDQETGTLYTQTKVYTVATSNPSGAAIGTDSLFTEAVQQSHRLWLSVTKPSSFIPILSGSAITSLSGARETLTTDSMYWPPVLESYSFDSVMNPIDPFADGVRFEMQFLPKIRQGYSGPVKCLVKEWWQATAPTATERPEINQLSMTPVAIRFPGRIQSFSLEPCLHGVVTFSEPQLLGTITDIQSNVTTLSGVGLKNRTWTAAATTPTDWPATYVVFKAVPENGGYRCEQRTFYRPDITGGGMSKADVDFVLATHGWRDPPIDGTIVSFP
jgi:hypothetical protein